MDILLILLLIVLNGMFAMSEIAVVSSRRARLKKRADDGSRGAVEALRLNAEPAQFLSSVQVGITTVAILSGAIGDRALKQPIETALLQLPLLAPYASTLAFVVTVVVLTYLSVVAGELVPKRIALLHPEALAVLVARPMAALARIARPVVWLLGSSSSAVLRVLRVTGSDEPPVSDDEIRMLIKQGADAGVFADAERQLVANVMRLDDQRIGEIMTPRVELDYVDISDDDASIAALIAQTPYRVLPVCNGGMDEVLGMLDIADLGRKAVAASAASVQALMRPPLIVPESLTTLQLLEQLRMHHGAALIVDEYGGVEGLVTFYDILSSIVGSSTQASASDAAEAVQRADGSWLVDATLSIAEVKRLFDVHRELPGEEDGDFNTVAGFVLHHLGRLPQVAEWLDVGELRFEVADLDGHRIDKLIISRIERDDDSG